MGSYAKAKLQ